MAIETNLNQSPYFDDFNENKNFHRVLFRPGYAVQARELTQLQTILQNQIERFANEVVLDGTVITGCGLIVDETNYVKLRDKDANNRVLLLGDFYSGGKIANCTITGMSSGVTAKLVTAVEGSESAAPNYLTVYCHYTNSGANNTTKTFSNNEILVFTTSGQTRSAGFVVAANTIQSGATGKALKANLSDGIIYHKGHFINVPAQTTIVGKYTLTPSSLVGIKTTESVVDSNADSSLLDNASGASNYAAPGASRLRLTPTLQTANLGFSNTVSFFSIAEVQEGKIVQKQTDTVYADLGKFMADRMYDTNGNFTIDPFNLRIREHLKKTNSLGRYTSAAGGDNEKLIIEIEKGVGYVGGSKIELQSTKYIETDKATTYQTDDNAAIGQQIGNYVFVKENVGRWDVQGLRQVTLYNAGQKAISNKSLSNEGVHGTAIGTANVRGFQYDSGTAGTWNAKYRLYIFNVKMNSGYSFSDVRAVRQENGTYDAIADIVLETNGSAKLQETNLNTLVFSFGRKAVRNLKDSSDSIASREWVYRQEKVVNFGTNGTTGGWSSNGSYLTVTENMNDVGSPLSNADERNIVVVLKDSVTAEQGGTISAFTGNTITGSSTSFDTQYRVGEFIEIADGANTVLERITEITNATTIKVANTISYTRSGVTLDHKTRYPAGYVFDLSSNGTITSTTTQHNISLNRGIFNTSFDAYVYYDVKRIGGAGTAKDVNKNKFVHINTGSHSASKTGPWSLGVCDAFKLVSVYKGGNTSVVTTDNDVTSHFELDDGQKDAFYDTSYLRQKADSTLDLTNCGLMVKFHYFSHNDAAGIGFYSMDSYLDIIDDDNPESATKITTQEIPVFTSPTSGRNYDLRDCVDFRPRKTNTVTPSATGTVAAAPTNPAALTAFYVKGTYGAYNPTPGENFESGIQYYLPRKDRVYVTSSGNFQVAQGIPDLSPTTPTTPTGAMSLGTLNIPPYPSLSPYVAKIYKRPDYAVKLTLDNNRRYTMSDLRAMDNRVKNLEYYSTLNLLETQAKNAQIFSASTGADRYKNGFFVDGFSSHNNADIRNKNYRAAIDSALGKLRPTYDRADVPMSQDLGLTSSNVTKTGDLITLSYTHESFINQPYASKLRNPVQELMFNWKGEVVLDPPMDNTPDITTLPDVQIDFSGFYDAIEFIANEAGVTGTDWGAWRTIASSSVSTAGAAVFNQIDDTWGDWLTQTTTTVTTSTQQQTGVVTTLEGASETISFGPLVENVSVRDYMRARTIRFTGLRMRPNTRVYAFFDDEAVSSYCTPTTSAFDATGSLEGDDLVTDSTGTVYGLFRIPDDENLRFRIGTKRFTLKDIEDPITQADLVTTSAHGDYTSIPLDVKQKSASIEMVVPQFSQDTVSRTRTVRSVTQSTRAWDPLAQSFFVSLPDETDGVYITKVDLFFGNKDSTLPVTVQLREMDNGTPTDIVVPYSSKTLYPADINVSTSTAVTPTTFTFDSPVFLQNGKDYTMVILPGGNSDQYTVWTAALGQYDVDAEDTLINKQIVAGTMFVSSNDKTWEPIQSEDLKFKLWRAKFSTSTGTVYVENNNEDYFSIDNISGSFRIGEPVRSECILTFANNDGMGVLSVGDVILSKAAKDGEAITASGFANGTIRQVVSANTGAGYWTVKIDALGDFTTDTSGNANYLYIPTSATSIGTATNFTANTATGTASFFHSAKNRLYVDASAGGFANGWVRGQLSGAASRVTSIDNLNMNTVVPKLPQIKHGKTQAAWAVRSTSTAGTIGSTWKAIELSQDNNFYDAQKKVYSYSNELGLGAVGGSTKTLTLRGTFTTTDDYVSPVIDSSRFNSIVLANRINNDATDEHKEYGNAQMRYISKKVTLADGQDAEDMVVYINAFKPQNTNINVYAKIINGEDGDAFVDKDYTPLRQVTSSNTYSTGVDGTDIREFEYTFSANTNGQDFLGSTWANNHAYLNTSDSDIVAYRGTDGAFYHTFKSFAIKIVMTSSGTNLVPLINDVRAIALQK